MKHTTTKEEPGLYRMRFVTRDEPGERTAAQNTTTTTKQHMLLVHPHHEKVPHHLDRSTGTLWCCETARTPSRIGRHTPPRCRMARTGHRGVIFVPTIRPTLFVLSYSCHQSIPPSVLLLPGVAFCWLVCSSSSSSSRRRRRIGAGGFAQFHFVRFCSCGYCFCGSTVLVTKRPSCFVVLLLVSSLSLLVLVQNHSLVSCS